MDPGDPGPPGVQKWKEFALLIYSINNGRLDILAHAVAMFCSRGAPKLYIGHCAGFTVVRVTLAASGQRSCPAVLTGMSFNLNLSNDLFTCHQGSFTHFPL